MKPAERTTIRYVAYGGYVVTAVGTAASVGGAAGWAVGVVLAALPGIAMIRYELDERSVRRDRAAGWNPERGYVPPGRAGQGSGGPSPEPLGTMPPPVPPAY